MNKTKFRTLFKLVEGARPDMSINEILDLMFIIDRTSFAELGHNLTGTIWAKTETSVCPANLTISDVMALVTL